jgi:hypothetical protein
MIGANPGTRVEGQDELPGKINYLVGDDQNKWHTNIPTYRKVHYAEIYPKVDLVYYGNRTELEYDFVVAPGGNPQAIKFRVIQSSGFTSKSYDNASERLPVERSLDLPIVYFESSLMSIEIACFLLPMFTPAFTNMKVVWPAERAGTVAKTVAVAFCPSLPAFKTIKRSVDGPELLPPLFTTTIFTSPLEEFVIS